ncbi:MAG TPA: Rrf2 family transcriptional regulator [Gemmatimonadaceae bacterium]|nr:Rrf2 family transcriptional regulator [Gemmatimonadaceae bacterium]
MRITTLAEYGVICALHLARRVSEGPVTGRDVAARERLPVDYVEQILLRLRRAGIVTSTRGARGGYTLARPAQEISVRDVIAASELTTFDLHCVSHPVEEERCSSAHNCSIRPVWMLLQKKIDDVLEGVRLVDLLEEESVVRTLVGLDESMAEPVAAPLAEDEGEVEGRRRLLPVLQ